MRPRWLCALALVAGCGRFGFDAMVGDGGSDDAPPTAETVVVPIAGASGVHDAVFGPGGKLAIVGNFKVSITIGALTKSTTTTNDDMFAAIVDPSGNADLLWVGGVTNLGTGQNAAWLPDGSLAVAAYFAGRLTNGGDLDAGSRQAALVMRFDPSGALAFARHYGGSANIQARGVAAGDDRVGVVGVYNSTVNFGAGPLPTTTQDNGFITTMNAAGGDVRHRGLLAGGDVFVNDITIVPGGDVYVVGRFNAASDFGLGLVGPRPGGSTAFVARYDAQLNLRWVRALGNASPATGIRVLSNGDCIVVGEVGGMIAIDGITVTPAGSIDGWIARFAAADGAVAWIRTLSGTGSSAIENVAVHEDRIFVAGQFDSDVVLAGTQPLVNGGANDAVVAELALDGSVVWSKQLGGTGTLDLGLGGMSVDSTGRFVAIATVYNGELLVDGQRLMSTAVTGAAIVLAIPE